MRISTYLKGERAKAADPERAQDSMRLVAGPRALRVRRLKGLSLNRMIPNILTLLALCAGMTAIRFALQDRWEAAGLAILIAAVLDGLDGRIARLLKGASRFGAELDSLSDFICFGTAPAMILYLWALQDGGPITWIVALMFSACCALRLARFNTNLDEPDAPPWASNFFTGVPAPAAAGLALLPMFLSLQVGDGFVRNPIVVSAVMITVAGLMVSRVPTFAFKKMKIANQWVLPTMVLVVLIAASLLTAPWPTVSAFLLIYIASIPFSVHAYRTMRRKAESGFPGEANAVTAIGREDDASKPNP